MLFWIWREHAIYFCDVAVKTAFGLDVISLCCRVLSFCWKLYVVSGFLFVNWEWAGSVEKETGYWD
ncbi:hypothetical protein KY284_021159 [Solanum tuberosum]|nr:hypothetical protein KY284_021159 [Solanum tuberosum]